MVNPSSFHNVTKKWVPDIRAHNPSSPIILVGTQSDLLLDVNVLINLDKSNVKPIPSSRARSMADKIRATDYIECSSLTQKNLKEAFDSAIFAAIKNKARKTKKRRFSDRRTKAFSRCSWKKFFCFIWAPLIVNPVGYGQMMNFLSSYFHLMLQVPFVVLFHLSPEYLAFIQLWMLTGASDTKDGRSEALSRNDYESWSTWTFETHFFLYG